MAVTLSHGGIPYVALPKRSDHRIAWSSCWLAGIVSPLFEWWIGEIGRIPGASLRDRELIRNQ